MAFNLKGTKTEKNLKEAFAGESMARNKYTFFAGEARKAGYIEIAQGLRADRRTRRRSTPSGCSSSSTCSPTTESEPRVVHRRREHGVDGHVRPHRAGGRGGRVRRHRELLHAAGRHREAPRDALPEGPRGAEGRRRSSRRGQEVYWYCTNCGHVEKGLEAPKACPVCAHPQGYFKALVEMAA